MAQHLIEDTSLQDITNAIRAKTGSTEKILISDISNKIAEMPSYVDGVDDGKTAEWNSLWDSLQQNGTRTLYRYAFAGWTQDAFKPKYDIVPGAYAQGLFYDARIENLDYLKENDIKLDLSNVVYVNDMFAQGQYYWKHLPELSFVSASSMSSVFLACLSLHTINKLI